MVEEVVVAVAVIVVVVVYWHLCNSLAYNQGFSRACQCCWVNCELCCCMCARLMSTDRTDSALCRSQSSSLSSLDGPVSKEAVQYLCFAETYARKSGMLGACSEVCVFYQTGFVGTQGCKNKIHFHAWWRTKPLNLVLVSTFMLCVMSVYLLVRLRCLSSFNFFCSKPSDWLWRTSLKWPILCWVEYKTLTKSVIKLSPCRLGAVFHIIRVWQTCFQLLRTISLDQLAIVCLISAKF